MLAVLWLLFLISHVDRVALSIIVDSVKADIGATDTEMSLALGPAFTLIYALSVFPFGWAADRMPRRWIIYVGTTLWSVAAAGTGLAKTPLQLFLARAGIGFGEASLSPSAFSLIADRFPRRRLAFATAVYQSAPWLGGATAFALTPLLFHNHAAVTGVLPFLEGLRPWQIALIMTGAPGLLLAFLVFTFSEPARTASRPSKPDEAAGFKGFLLERRSILLVLTFAFGLISMMAYAVQAWVPTYLQRQFGLASIEFGPSLSIIGVLGSISLFIKGSLMDWIYARGVRDAYMCIYIILLFLSWLPAMILFYTSSFSIFVVCYGVVQIITVSFMGFLVPTLQIITPPQFRGRIIGILLLMLSGFGALGPVLIGFATDHILHDPQKIGIALRVMASLVVPIAFGLLLISLKTVRALIVREFEEENFGAERT